ncbi:uncharacterized protein ARMOST_02282 [Armillaria ostoyae]|uniref:Uncharacterized protein n=1 Tax=Armillaria ostoyae TaxID=47428 RepID=A0A284QRH9_ARMOS|nr:uncharacterized protein ARMOST_02282 [Armillaria ostoyae]
MCRRRQNVYLRCGHTINLPEQIVRRILHDIIRLDLDIEYFPRFNARSLTASSVSSILRVVNHQVVYRPVGSTFAIQNSIPSISTGIVPLAPSTCSTKTTINNNKIL